MTRVLDPPVTTDSPREALHPDGEAAEVVPHLGRGLPVTDALRDDHAQRLQALPLREPRQAVRRQELDVRPGLFAAVTGFFRDGPSRADVLQSVLHLFVEVVDDRLMQRPLVPLERQHVVAAAVHDVGRNRLLRPHRIDGEDRPANVDQLEHRGNRRDFVGFVVAGDLGQRQSEVAGPDADRVQRPQSPLPVVTPPRRLAIDRQHRLRDAGGRRRGVPQRREPRREADLKGVRFQRPSTRRKTSFPGTPCGRSSVASNHSSFSAAQRAIAVGPPAPASTAINAMTTTLASGCRRLIVDRGSSSASKYRTTSSSPTDRAADIPDLPVLWQTPTTESGITIHQPERKPSQALQVTQSARWPCRKELSLEHDTAKAHSHSCTYC